MLGPDFQTPEAPVADEWLETSDPQVNTQAEEYSDWWTVFNDPVLDHIIELAYQQNLPLQIAGIRILESRALLGIAIGSQYPQQQQVSGGITYNELSERSPNFFAAFADSSFGAADIGFDAVWELDVWGRFRRGIEAADANLAASVATYDDVLVSLTAECAATYVQIRTFEERIAIAHQNVTIQQRSLEIALVRFENGATTELDVQQAKALLTQTQATIPALEAGLRQAKNALSVLLGMPPSELQAILEGAGVIPTTPAEVAIGMPADLLRRRPDIRAAELQAAAQSAQIGIARTDLYPQFNLVGSIGFLSSTTGSSSLSDLFTGDAFTATVGPTFQWPIFNYGRLKNNVRFQDATFQGLIVNYQNTVLEAAREVEDGLVGFLQGQKQAKYLAESVAASERSVELSLLQYRDGVADYQRVLDSQQRLVTSQDQLTATRGDVVTSLISVYKALGGGWQIRAGHDFVPEETIEEMGTRTDWGELLAPEDVQLPDDLPVHEKPDKLFYKPLW